MTSNEMQTERTLDFLKIWHSVFSKNLEYVVEGIQSESGLDPDEVGNDQTCQMGLWLREQDAAVASLPAYAHLIEVHHTFHEASRDLIVLHQKGNHEAARAFLHSIFAEQSQAVWHSIDQLADALTALGIYPPRFKAEAPTIKSIWSESLEIGIADIDTQHHKIALLIDECLVNGDIDCGSNSGIKFLSTLLRIILKDIETENTHLLALQKEGGDCGPHLAAHENIIAYMTRVSESIASGHSISFAEVGNHLANWYIDHLITYDLDLEDMVTLRKEAA